MCPCASKPVTCVQDGMSLSFEISLSYVCYMHRYSPPADLHVEVSLSLSHSLSLSLSPSLSEREGERESGREREREREREGERERESFLSPLRVADVRFMKR